jgi:NifU-like protein involved in Fe-S cluster formation
VSNDPYSALVRNFFENPTHGGDLEGARSASAEGQGVRLTVAAIATDSVIESLGFRARGCPHVIAAAEAFCANYEGRPVADLIAFSAAELMQSLPVPEEKTGRILVLEDAVRALGQKVSGSDHQDNRD